MNELTSRTWIVVKGMLFAAIALATAALILLEKPSATRAVLLALLVWASCRFYYFLFYVLERYVDAALRYAGVVALLAALRHRRRG
jgi:hypothetical protein